MGKQACKQCGKIFKYCSACSFKTIYYHEEGFCSDECCTKYRLSVAQKELEPIVGEEPIVPVEELAVEETVEVEQSIEEEIPVQTLKKSKYKWDTRVVD